MATLRLLLIRHGQSEINTRLELINGQSSSAALTKQGREEAKLLGSGLAKVLFFFYLFMHLSSFSSPAHANFSITQSMRSFVRPQEEQERRVRELSVFIHIKSSRSGSKN